MPTWEVRLPGSERNGVCRRVLWRSAQTHGTKYGFHEMAFRCERHFAYLRSSGT